MDVNLTADFAADYDQSVELDDEQTRRIIQLTFTSIYGLIFIGGTFGNGYVIVMLIRVLASIFNKKTSGAQRMSAMGTTPVYIYILGLSIVDLLVVFHLPLLIFDILEGQWLFGTVLCKIYWAGENVNKLLSSFILTVLSWDRYLCICSPITSLKYRNNTFAIGVLLICVAVATLLLYPVIVGSTVHQINRRTADQVDEMITSQEVVTKCVFDTSSPMTFTLITFSAGFVAPALLIIFFYLRVILRLHENTKNVRKHSDSFSSMNNAARLHKVTQRIVAIVLSYFVLFSPQWVLTMALQMQFIVTSWSRTTLNVVFFGAHFLLCFNSALNPIWYALINRELRYQHNEALRKRRKSAHLNAQRIQSDKPSIIPDSLGDYFVIPQRRHFSYQQRHSSGSTDPNARIFAAFADRCRASLPQTKLSKSLMGLRAVMTTGASPSSERGGRKHLNSHSNSFVSLQNFRPSDEPTTPDAESNSTHCNITITIDNAESNT
ncbi:G-PROTEIN-RECEP-F1-2 domain-containing protein [Aphelenchoides besseyi]|nr:G-PROTEIN-RECEP-F1-2 domain-containing protein [Aphelenchoides besseyi]